jgi:hypothetical protein
MRRGNIFWGSIIIVLGIVLLFNQFFPGINVWGLFWPITLILLGVWFLFGRSIGGSLATEQVNLPLSDIREARIRFHHGAGRLEVSPAAEPGTLIAGSFMGGVEQRLERNGSAASLDLRAHSDAVFFGWPGPLMHEGLTWNVTLTRDIPLQLEVETGASETRLNLRDLLVTELLLKTGASSTVATLPARAGMTRMNVQVGVASVEIHLPEGVAGRIRVKSGLAAIHIDPNRFPASAGGYETPGFDSAANKADIYVETGVGSIDIR